MTEDVRVQRAVRIANCSGFFGDRLAAAREMVDGGPIDVLTGDWLAELTMLILARQRMKHGEGSGYARTFLTQMADVLGDCLERGIRVVSNAGGLDPAGCAAALRVQADEAGFGHVCIAYVDGDDLMPRMAELSDAGETWVNLDTGVALADAGIHPLTANAYIGGRAIALALAEGADVVITGRCTDAALVVGPAAWWHGWSFDCDDQADLDRLAGAVVAGHIIECGAQATGGNYSFFSEVSGIEHVGFPIAEVEADGSSVISKHDGTGGLVSVGTVTAQLLYEIGGPQYANPDVVARFDSIALEEVGPDRVRVSGVVGEPAPARLKVALNYLGGFRNSMTLVLTGLDVDAKADVALRQVTGLGLEQCLAATSPRELAAQSSLGVQELLVRFNKVGSPDPTSVRDAQSLLQISVKDLDPTRAGRAFTSGVVEAALGSYPGMFPTTPPGQATPFGIYWPTTVDAAAVTPRITHDPVPTPTP
ncbi:MAG: acyclic terpene utilization AtuA family protein, partial [Actinomycetes bacterium]